MDPTTSAKAAEETARAVQEVAKTAGQGIQATREAASYVAQLLRGPLEQAVAILEDRLRFIGWRQKVQLLVKARAFAAEHGMPEPTRRVPLSLLVPLLEAGAAEEDDELQDTWARMLANAADADHGAEVRRAYVSILSDCTSLDVRNLATLYNVKPELHGKNIASEFLPDWAVPVMRRLSRGRSASRWNRHGRCGTCSASDWLPVMFGALLATELCSA
jgi:hypothetical protein